MNKKTNLQQILTSLTFQDGKAEQAMNFYVSVFSQLGFENSQVISLTRWGEEMPEMTGKVMQARFELNGHAFMCSDSPAIHEWNFSPAVSTFIECDSEEMLAKLFNKLFENGTVTMSIANYGFSQQFAWVLDQFGVSWQLNLQ